MTSPRARTALQKAALVAALVGLASVAACATDGEAVDYGAVDLTTGEDVSTAALRGQPVLLVSWATWCRECDQELASLQAFASSPAADGIEVVAVNLDAASVEDQIDAKITRAGLDVTLWRDRRNQFRRSFSALGVPTTVLLDADGVVVATYPGGVDLNDDDLLATLAGLRGAS